MEGECSQYFAKCSQKWPGQKPEKVLQGKDKTNNFSIWLKTNNNPIDV